MAKSKAPTEPTPPPAHLSERSQGLWMAAVRPGNSHGRLAMIEQALAALDRADAAREAIGRDGMTTTNKDTGLVHVHPLLKVEKDARAQFAALWGKLGLHFNPMHDGRL